MIECICGHGDDGRHSVIKGTLFGSIIVCPYAPPSTLWAYDAKYLNVRCFVENIGYVNEDAGGASSLERDDGTPNPS